MWLLGFFIGDGYFDGPNRITFAVPDEDPACERVREVSARLFGQELKRARGVQLRSASGAWVDWLRAAGFDGDAHTKRVPVWVYRLPRSQKRAFIDGYIAADGHMRPGHRNVSITSASRSLLEQVRQLAISAGLNPTKIAKWTRRELKPLGIEEKQHTHFVLYFSDEHLDAPVHFVPVAGMEYAGEQATYDIEVEGTANFIANGIFVHNSRLTMKYPASTCAARTPPRTSSAWPWPARASIRTRAPRPCTWRRTRAAASSASRSARTAGALRTAAS